MHDVRVYMFLAWFLPLSMRVAISAATSQNTTPLRGGSEIIINKHIECEAMFDSVRKTSKA